MFKITEHPIDHSKEALKLENPKAGGVVFFEGRVRNHNDGLDVTSLEYQCYESMAEKEGQKIVNEALEKFDIHNAICIHRHGHLKIKEIAIWVGVSSSHRKEAFEACQYIVDEVKAYVPIWKKEHYTNKEPHWVACHQCKSKLNHDHEPLGEAP
ncbi:MAG: molybdenum cofactor biosynthesis protein MoaE [Bacteriovoracaceae bacterium]|nr:molybdenum cofactor biosynthesis protein MoaE [Bacteriovoracaceae bacterium]